MLFRSRREHESHQVLELRVLAGLGDIREDPRVEDFHDSAGRLLARHDDHGDRAVERADLPEEREPVQALHLRIDQDEVGAAAPERGRGRAAARRRLDVVRAAVREFREVAPEDLGLGRLVVEDQDALARQGSGPF